MLARYFERHDIAPGEIVVAHRIRAHDGRIGRDAVLAAWRQTCRSLGPYRPQLAALDGADDYLAAAPSPAERDRRLKDILEACRALGELKAAAQLAGVGIAANDWRVAREIDAAAPLDWLVLSGGLTLLDHPPELLAFLTGLAARQIPIVVAGVFHCDFLVGGNTFDGRPLNPENSPDRSILAWRKSFVALCHGHGIGPAHAAIQFALRAPGVAAVAINTTRPGRIAENVAASRDQIPAAFWAALNEEGLLAEEYPHV
jgi:D-threo-aldose 1-dehydrogenase